MRLIACDICTSVVGLHDQKDCPLWQSCLLLLEPAKRHAHHCVSAVMDGPIVNINPSIPWKRGGHRAQELWCSLSRHKNHTNKWHNRVKEESHVQGINVQNICKATWHHHFHPTIRGNYTVLLCRSETFNHPSVSVWVNGVCVHGGLGPADRCLSFGCFREYAAVNRKGMDGWMDDGDVLDSLTFHVSILKHKITPIWTHQSSTFPVNIFSIHTHINILGQFIYM